MKRKKSASTQQKYQSMDEVTKTKAIQTHTLAHTHKLYFNVKKYHFEFYAMKRRRIYY